VAPPKFGRGIPAVPVLKFAPQLNKIEKFAVVSPSGWMEQVPKALSPLLPFETRHFEPGQRLEGLAWLKENA